MKTINKYHIITDSHDSGEDAKQDTSTLQEAIKLAKEWLKDEYYHKVRIFGANGIVREFINIGNGQAIRTPKYSVNYFDGCKFHPDGSEFYNIAIFSNKKERDAFIAHLKAHGYKHK